MLKKISRSNFPAITLCTSLFISGVNLFLPGCVPPPSRYRTVAIETPQPPPPPAEVYFYPNQGQDQEQQNRDSYECYLWAANQTGFDPSIPNLAPHHKLTVVPERPPGSDTAAGAITGAVLGAALSSRGNMPEGALLGGIAGAVIGAASDSNRREQTDRLQHHYDLRSNSQIADIERQAANYRRAMLACLEGRGYSVQ